MHPEFLNTVKSGIEGASREEWAHWPHRAMESQEDAASPEPRKRVFWQTLLVPERWSKRKTVLFCVMQGLMIFTKLLSMVKCIIILKNTCIKLFLMYQFLKLHVLKFSTIIRDYRLNNFNVFLYF